MTFHVILFSFIIGVQESYNTIGFEIGPIFTSIYGGLNLIITLAMAFILNKNNSAN